MKLGQSSSTTTTKETAASVHGQERQQLLGTLERPYNPMGGSVPSSNAHHKYDKLDGSMIRDNEQFVDDEGARQSAVLQHQDARLDRMMAPLGVLKTQAGMMHDELGYHSLLLDDLETGVTSTRQRLKNVTQSVVDFMRGSKDRKSLAVIGALLLIVVVLLIIITSV